MPWGCNALWRNSYKIHKIAEIAETISDHICACDFFWWYFLPYFIEVNQFFHCFHIQYNFLPVVICMIYIIYYRFGIFYRYYVTWWLYIYIYIYIYMVILSKKTEAILKGNAKVQSWIRLNNVLKIYFFSYINHMILPQIFLTGRSSWKKIIICCLLCIQWKMDVSLKLQNVVFFFCWLLCMSDYRCHTIVDCSNYCNRIPLSLIILTNTINKLLDIISLREHILQNAS